MILKDGEEDGVFGGGVNSEWSKEKASVVMGALLAFGHLSRSAT